jgi:glycosyltransferase involved in cell wall biosynthesis
MRMLFCQTSPYLPEEVGGALTNTHALCGMLAKRGCDVSVLAGTRSSLRTALQAIGRRNSTSLGYPIYRERDPLAAARRLCRKGRPALAIVQLGDIAGLTNVFLEEKVPVLIYFHDPYSVDPAVVRGSEALLRYAASSEYLAAKVSKLLNCEVSELPVIINPADYWVETERRVVTFFNPIPRKGVEIAFALAAQRPDIPFEFVEAWQLGSRVLKYLRARTLHHGNIRLLRNSLDIRPVYRQSRIILAPSLWDEAWGRVVSEAHVSGIPALVSDSGGLPAATGPGGLIVSRVAPIAEWLRALGLLWDDVGEYETLSFRAAEHAARPEFRADTIVDRATEIFKAHASS